MFVSYFCIFVVYVVYSLICIVSPFAYSCFFSLFLYNFTDRCHRVETQLQYINRTARRIQWQLQKFNFSGERKNHWPWWCNHIKRTIDTSPLSLPFQKLDCDAIPLGRYGLRHSSPGHNSKWASFELWQCSSRGAKYHTISCLTIPPNNKL
jgi:hypothetical protein